MNTPNKQKLEHAKNWLFNQLIAGPKHSAAIIENAKVDNISRVFLRKARYALNINITHEYHPKNIWLWQLPAPAPAPEVITTNE